MPILISDLNVSNYTSHIIIIAEAGVNHNGSIEMARLMVDAAASAGADYIKFQTAVPELVISSIAPKAEYQKETTGTSIYHFPTMMNWQNCAATAE